MTQVDEKNDSQRNVKETTTNYQLWFIPKPESSPEKETQKILWNFETQTDYVILNRRPDQKMRTSSKGDFAVPTIHSENQRDRKEREVQRNKKLSNIKVTVIPAVIGALGTIFKGLERGLNVKTIS